MSEFKTIEELFGKKLGLGDSDKASPTNFLDTGIPQLNSIISGTPDGGLPSGRIAEISGESASGKTMLATRLMISAQKQNGFAMFYDFERAYEKKLSIKQGMDDSPNKWFYKKAKILEEALEDCVLRAKLIREHKLIPDNAPIVAIFDSFAAMTPKSKAVIKGTGNAKDKEKTLSEYTMNDTTSLARAASACLPTFNADCDDYGVCAVFLNQLADTMALHGPAKKTKGGNSLPFYASTRLHIKGVEVKVKGVLVKKQMTITTKKNRLRKPGEAIEVDFVFNDDGSGDFDTLGSYALYLKNIGAIESSGAWLTYGGERIMGMPALIERLYKDPKAARAGLEKLHVDFVKSHDTVPHVADPDWSIEDEET